MVSYVVIVLLAAALVLVPALARKDALSALPTSAAGGLVGLCAVQLSGLAGPPLLALNPFTVGVAALLGLPGVVSMLMLRLIAVL